VSPDPNPAHQATSEDHVVARAQRGEEEVFATLYHKHKRSVYSLCLSMTGDPAEAAELSQEAFAQFFRKISGFCGELALAAWLLRLTVNVILAHFGEREIQTSSPERRLDSKAEPMVLSQCDGDANSTTNIDRRALSNAITELPLRCRAIFALHDIEGYGHNEVASIMACSIADSKSQLLQARLKLRDVLRRNQDRSETLHALLARHRTLSS
jgi:RNA polymerase sigma-70 factor, ECF subfamily